VVDRFFVAFFAVFFAVFFVAFFAAVLFVDADPARARDTSADASGSSGRR